MTTDRFYTVAEIAKELGVTAPAVYKWIRSGKLEAYQFGDAYRITEEAYKAFIDASKVKPDPL